MGRIFRWTLLLVVLVIFASGAVAFYSVFFSERNEVTMPLLRNMSILEAEREAQRLGLQVSPEMVVSSLPQGLVVAQSPEAGVKIRSDRTILLKVSRGGARRTIPDVRRLSVSEAQNILQEKGFDMGDVIYIKDESRPGGTVIAQSPAAPANIPSDKKVDLLVSQGGAGVNGSIMIPDVAGLSEREARALLTENGFKIAVVDSVFSPNETEGKVIGTRPAGGTMVRLGEGVRLRVATNKRPEGTPERPVTVSQGGAPAVSNPSSRIEVEVPGQGNVFIGDRNDVIASGQIRTLDPNISVFDQTQRSVNTPAPQPADIQPAQPPQQRQTQSQPQQNLQPVGGKVAKIRYQVPPLARPLNLKIELTDPSGSKVLLDRNAKSGEYVSMDVPYSKECVVRIYLGDQSVWQDRYM